MRVTAILMRASSVYWYPFTIGISDSRSNRYTAPIFHIQRYSKLWSWLLITCRQRKIDVQRNLDIQGRLALCLYLPYQANVQSLNDVTMWRVRFKHVIGNLDLLLLMLYILTSIAHFSGLVTIMTRGLKPRRSVKLESMTAHRSV